MNEYVTALKNYAVFSGKATRKDFWMFVLVNFVISIAIGLLQLEMVSNIYSLALIVPSLAIGARRLHDTNRTGWWQLIAIIPIIGWIVLLVFYIQPSAQAVESQPAPAPAAAPEPAPAPAENTATEGESTEG